MVATKHSIHQYMRVQLKNSVVYRCMLPGCSHYKRAAFIVNSIAKCWYCGNDFMITRELAKRKRVHCDSCTERNVKITVPDIQNFLEELKKEEDDDNNAA
jgi:hypothetical protein